MTRSSLAWVTRRAGGLVKRLNEEGLEPREVVDLLGEALRVARKLIEGDRR